jgi:hypothetical protein
MVKNKLESEVSLLLPTGQFNQMDHFFETEPVFQWWLHLPDAIQKRKESGPKLNGLKEKDSHCKFS